MTRFSLPLPATADFQPVIAALTLSPKAVDWATTYCQHHSDRRQRWQALLHGMALMGVQQWLEAGATPFDIQLTPDHQLVVNDYRLQVIPIGSLMDDWVPRPTTPLPHLYLLTEVLEETNQITVLGALRGDHLQRHCAAQGLAVAACDRLALSQFSTTPQQVLLYLSCLPADRLMPSPATAAPSQTAPSRFTNISHWLQDQLDAAVEQLTWRLLPPLTPAAVRGGSAADTIASLLQEIDPQHQVIPPTVRGAYQTVAGAGHPLQLYALVWAGAERTAPLEWGLLLVLTAPDGEHLPDGLRLRIRDPQTLLADQVFTTATGATALFAQVFGQEGELLTASISLPEGQPLVLPPFTYQSPVS